MGAAGRLEKQLSGLVCSLFLPRNLCDDLALQHVSQNKAGVMMRLPDPSRRVVYVADRYLPAVHGEVRQIVFENRTRRPAGWLTGGCVWRLGMCSAQFAQQSDGSCEGFSACNHEPIIRAWHRLPGKIRCCWTARSGDPRRPPGMPIGGLFVGVRE